MINISSKKERGKPRMPFEIEEIEEEELDQITQQMLEEYPIASQYERWKDLFQLLNDKDILKKIKKETPYGV